jgi:murein DD-endopeptidase MepM/ murein hydrolase activator NlpD
MAERFHLMRAAATAMLCVVLAACNQSGRPRNVAAPKPAATVAVAPRVNAADFGKVIGSDYVVAPGDTLAVVAERNDTSIRSLIDMNNLQPPYALAPGMHLALKPRSQYVVQQGDTVASLAQRYGISESTLVSVNNLQPPYKVTPGERLSIPSTNEASNQPAMTAAAVPPPTPAGSVSSAPLPAPSAPMPTVTTTAPSAPMPTVSGPSVSTQTLPAPTTTTVTPMPSATSTAPLPTPTAPKPAAPTQTVTLPAPIPAQPAPAAKPAAVPPPQQPAATVPDDTAETASTAVSGPAAGSGKGAFAWPVQGKVISTFGSSKDGTKNDGINIAAPSGAPVVAAADGTVAYAGNELRGFGNMILIRHDGGYVTAYAHNASLLVKKGDKVKRGQTIARVGATGAVFGPQVHFEIRKGTQPVDPMSFLGG